MFRTGFIFISLIPFMLRWSFVSLIFSFCITCDSWFLSHVSFFFFFLTIYMGIILTSRSVLACIYRDLGILEYYWHAMTLIHGQVSLLFISPACSFPVNPFKLDIIWFSLCLILQYLVKPDKLSLCGLDPHRLHRPDRLQDNTRTHLVNILKVCSIAY